MSTKGKTCFVIIGYGTKTDYKTGQQYNLDMTFDNIIKPVFDELEMKCFRAKDLIYSGSIDKMMYHWIYTADLVVADLSTLNPNAIYELGVRHALRPYSTIIITEDKLDYPFDLNHTIFDKYKHLGDDIGVSEANRFRKKLKEKSIEILKNPQNDSPVYTYLSDLLPPKIKEAIATRTASISKEIAEEQLMMGKEDNLSNILKEAEAAKNSQDFPKAIELFKKAHEKNKNDSYIIQRLVLCTYKNKTKNPVASLKKAQKTLAQLKPDTTTDPETLGLSGAISKRLYEETSDMVQLRKSLEFYERGFNVKQDYYNGINAAYMYTLLASLTVNPDDSSYYYIRGVHIRVKVKEICEEIIKQKNFKNRNDKEWVYQTLAQSYLGMGMKEKADELIPKINEYSKGGFDKETFYEQNAKLIELIALHNKNQKP